MRQRALQVSSSCLLVAVILASPAPGQAPNGWIQDVNWLLLGPLGSAGGCDPGMVMAQNWIAPEEIATITPGDNDPLPIDFAAAASESWQGAGDSPVWTCLGGLGLPGSDLVNMEDIVLALSAGTTKAIPTTQVMAVLVTYVTNTTSSPLPVNVCTASDDSIQIWVNDQKVQEVHACRGTAGGCAEEAGALLVPGKNAIKVLLWQGVGGFSFRLRLKRLDSGPITSADPEVRFGCGHADAVALNAYRVERRFLLDVPDCAVPGGMADVVLDGGSSAGPNLTITEQVIGAAAVENITGGGTFTPTPSPPLDPLGIFDGAADVGSPCGTGSTVQNADGSYTVTGSGFDIWTEGDNFHYAYRLVRGDFTMTAHVRDRTWAAGTRWGKAGLMARQSLSGASRYSMIQTHGEDLQDADRFAGRPTHGGSNNFEQLNLAPGEHRDWMRLERAGSRITGSFSADGVTWEPAGSMDWGAEAPPTVLLGLAVSSHGGCEPASLTFDQVSISGAGQNPGPLPPDGGAIVWKDLPRATLDAGVGYRLRGRDRVVLHGHDGEHLIEGNREVLLQGGAGGVGIFNSAQDIGQPCAAGSTAFEVNSGSYTVTGGGNDIWSGDDQFQYAYARVNGNFSIRARVRDRAWAPGVRWGKGGLMARESCQSDSRYSFMHDSPEPDNARFAVQRQSGQASNQEFGYGGHPEWLRLDRLGSTFAGYTSEDGVVWTFRYKEAWSAPVPSTVLAGLALTSHGGCVPATLVFDQVTLSPIDYAVSRRAGKGSSGCPEGALGVKVELKGTGPPGASVLVNEEVHGQVEVKNITGGGVFTPFRKPAYTRVGMWADARDIGNPCFAGSTVDNGDGSYTLTGGGVDIWQGGDQFHFAYVEASGDFSLTTRIAERNWAGGSRWGKVGLMARQSHDARSRYVGLQDHGVDPQDQTRWAARPSHAGADNYETVPLVAGEHHDWLRLERAGDEFIGWSSLDGLDWVEQGRQLWSAAPRTVLLGLEVSSHMDCNPTTIKFDSIDYQGGNGPPGTVPDGGTISWSAPRAVLEAGLSYEVTSAGNSFTGFNGTADGVEILGDDSYAITDVKELEGPFPRSHDVGNPCVPGSTVYDAAAGSYTVTGSGSDIWQGGDQFQFAYREVTGDYFVAVARIAERSWAQGSRWGKVGIMARQDCTSRSRYAMIQDHGEDLQDQSRFASRRTHGGADNFEQTALPGAAHHDWTRLDREGSVFTGYTSSDGQVWERQGSVDFGVTAPPTVLLGLAVCSHDGCEPATITFDNLRIETVANRRPVACIETDPSPPTVPLVEGKAGLTLKGTCSHDGDGGAQGLTYFWARASGPAGVNILTRNEATTRVEFTRAGTYRFRLTVNDGQFTNSTASVLADVTVTDQPPPPRLRRGDADVSGIIDLTDAVKLLSYLFLGQAEPECLDAADVDDSGVADISDAISSLQFLFLGGAPPAAPRDCGPDPTPETPELGCEKSCG